MSKIILTNDKKKPATFTISGRHIEWMNSNIPENKKSALVDALLARYIKRAEAQKKDEGPTPERRAEFIAKIKTTKAQAAK